MAILSQYKFLKSAGIVVGLSMLIVATAPASAAVEWPDAISQSTSDGQLVLTLPIDGEEWSADPSKYIVEIDNFDITEMTAFQATGLSYTALQPLDPGSHTFRVYELDESGDYVLRAEYEFQTTSADGGSNTGGSLTAESDNDLEISQRLFETNIDGSLRDTTASGAGTVGARYENGRWSIDFNTNYFLESEPEISQTGNEFDIGEYTARFAYSGDNFGAEANIGHHDIGIESLSFSGFNRRGISLKSSIADDRLQITGFSLSSDSIAGVDDIVGQKEDGGYVVGGAIAGRPVWNEDAKIELTGLYFTSKGGEADFGSGGGLGVDAAPKGQGAAFIADTLWYEDRLRVRGEYAYSDMDLDGDEALLSKDDADAQSFSIDYDLIRDDGTRDTPLSLKVGAKYEKVDTYFYSLANTGLATDRDGYSAFANLYWGSFALNAYTSLEQNNVDDNSDIATDQVFTAALDGSYSFDPSYDENGDVGWLGTPYMGFGVNYMGADRVETPVGYLGDDTNNNTGNAYVNFGSSYNTWNWQVGYTHSFYNDHADVTSDTINEMVDLSAYWNVTDDVSLSAGTQFNRYVEKTNSERSYNVTGNLGLQAAIVPEVLNARVDYNMNLSSGSGDIPDRHLVTTEMEWTLIPAEINSAGVAIAFRGAMEKEHGNADSSLDDTAYEGFFVLKFKAPLVY
ncbi:MAG: hypothetical protein JJ879_01480 [Sneathiella sp.]|nr:hypothetical protein [Sneathiella sp.]